MTESSDSRLLLLSGNDNVVIARTNLARGDVVTIDGVQVTLLEDVHLGFKIARCDLGSATRSSSMARSSAPLRRDPPWDIVHLHNMKSDYLPTYSHEAGVGFTKRTG